MMNDEWFQQIVDVLNTYGTLPEEEWKVVQPFFNLKTYTRDDYLIRDGEVPTWLGFILKGGVRHFLIDETGRERITDFCLAGEFTGSLEVFSDEQEPAGQWISAIEETVVAMVDRTDLSEKILIRPAFQELFRRILLDYYKLKSRRESDLLCNDAFRRYENFLLHFPDLSNRIPQYQIASFLGISAETLSRLRSAR